MASCPSSVMAARSTLSPEPQGSWRGLASKSATASRQPASPSRRTAPKATGATGPSLSTRCSYSTCRRPSAMLKSPLFIFTKRLPSVICISIDGCRRPTRSTSVSRDASRTASTNQSRCLSWASVCASRTTRGYDRMHHLPRHW
ncbi:MAG: hypothetical protein IJ634_04500 [Bacteroidales bacterium]|nr:hypothetical protein [Bacteroidales bacterium]